MLEATGHPPGTDFIMYSPTLPTGHDLRVHFWYYMFGDEIGSLTLYEIFGANNDVGEIVWRAEGGDRTSKSLLSHDSVFCLECGALCNGCENHCMHLIPAVFYSNMK